MSNVKRTDIWTVVRTVLDKNPGIRAKELIKRVRKKTGYGRSTIYSHLESFDIKGKIHREKGRYWLPERKRIADQIQVAYPTPKIGFEITQQIINDPHGKRELPIVGFNMFPNPNDYPIRVKVETRIVLGGRNLGLIRDRKGYYSGETEWNLNPGDAVWNGSFSVPKEAVNSVEELTIEMRATIVDPSEKEHKVLPRSWTYVREKNAWYYEPRTFTNGS